MNPAPPPSTPGLDRFHLRLALRRNPDDAALRLRLAQSLMAEGHWEEAITQLEPLPQGPAKARCWAKACLGRGDLAAAETLDVTDAEALGAWFGAQHLWAQAEACFTRARALAPEAVAPWFNSVLARRQVGAWAAADALAQEAQGRFPHTPEFRYMEAELALIQGDYPRGWRRFEARWEVSGLVPWRELPLRRWQGERLEGQRVLVRCEQGLGDTLMMARFLPRLTTLGAQAVWMDAPSALASLLKDLPGLTALLGPEDGVPPDTLQVPLLSLPHLLGIGAGDLTPDGLYLPAPAPDALGLALPSQGLKVGVVWQGNAAHARDAERSLEPGRFHHLEGLAGCTWVSLQVGSEEAFPLPHLDAAPALATLRDTAALLQVLDLLITVDTSVAHLAGALGLPAVVLLPFSPDWRWGTHGTTTPWYPSLRLLRQARAGDWGEPLAALRALLLRATTEGLGLDFPQAAP